jgi:hypothetical protein
LVVVNPVFFNLGPQWLYVMTLYHVSKQFPSATALILTIASHPAVPSSLCLQCAVFPAFTRQYVTSVKGPGVVQSFVEGSKANADR